MRSGLSFKTVVTLPIAAHNVNLNLQYTVYKQLNTFLKGRTISPQKC